MLMVKVFAMVQDICAKLSPDFVLLKETKPLLLKSFKRRILKEADLRQVGLSLLEKFDNLAEIPKNVDAALKQLSKGSYLLKIPDDDIQKLERIADRTSYRILLGLVVSSILIGMSIVILATQNMLGVVEPIQITLLIYAIAILIIVISVVQLVRSRDKH
jgi:predicted unusual protein kinase regulating ubiquinone biosynthesis (AarF/ABC1/UbiB family)